MILKGRTLRLDMRGADVDLLLGCLRELRYDIPSGETHFGRATLLAIQELQRHEKLEPTGIVDDATAAAIGRLLDRVRTGGRGNPSVPPPAPVAPAGRLVRGHVSHADGRRLVNAVVRAFDRDLRREEPLGESGLDSGRYEIPYSSDRFVRAEKQSADLIVRVFGPDGRELGASDVWFNAPANADVDISIPLGRWDLPSLFETIGASLTPLLRDMKVTEIEENPAHQDLSFLAGETGITREVLARFVVAHRLVEHGIEAQFWFGLLGDAPFDFSDLSSMDGLVAIALAALPKLDAATALKALARAFGLKEISSAYEERTSAWLEELVQLIGRRSVAPSTEPTFVKAALEHAGVTGADRQERVARLFTEHRELTPAMLKRLEHDELLDRREIADLRTSFRVAEISRGDFSTVRVLKETFELREPDQVRQLARRSEAEWIDLVTSKHAAGDLNVPLLLDDAGGQLKTPTAELFGKALHRRFTEAFPTTAFAGGLERRLQNGGPRGLQHAESLRGLLARHEDLDLLRTPIDRFLDEQMDPELRPLASDPAFRLELKAVQRVFKLAQNFDATDTLIADHLHAALQIYRVGEGEFVERYASRDGFTADSARMAWNRAADTYAAVVTFIGDLIALDDPSLPRVLRGHKGAGGGKGVAAFPNWNNLFKTGDLCECEHCRSVLGPAAYFADLLVFLRDRWTPSGTPKELLFRRRPDLGYLELSCENASTLLPYIDVVNEVLEDAVTAGDPDVELSGFTTMPSDPALAKQAVATALAQKRISLGADFSLSEIDPDRWVAHGDDVTYLLKRTTANFFAEILRNTKTSAAELRAYPQYVDRRAYVKLRQARYPFTLPFDLFAEEVRAALQKSNVKRWELMHTVRSSAPPNSPTEVDVACEYFGISIDTTAPIDEQRLMLTSDPTVAGQQQVWGEVGNAAWLTAIGNVQTFLRKTNLEYTELLSLLDLTFINPAGTLAIQHPASPSCDVDQKTIQPLDAATLDHIHRFLRLWRKLKGWEMWELDLCITRPELGAGKLNDKLVFQLHHFCELRKRLGPKTSVEQTLALLGPLNTTTHFTKAHEKRADGLYQALFLNRKLTQPLDPAFEVAAVTAVPPTVTLAGHRPVLLAALGLGAPALDVLLQMKNPAGARYIGDDLTLDNLSFLWRHAWLAKQLKWKVQDWAALLTVLGRSVERFAGPKPALDFIDRIDRVRDAQCSPDELLWLLAADRSAKAAVTDTDVARILRGLRKELQAIRAEYDPAQFDLLANPTPTDDDQLAALLTGLLQKLNRREADVREILLTLRGPVLLVTSAEGLPPAFAFPLEVTEAPAYIPIRHDGAVRMLRFTGVMSVAQRDALLDDASAALTRLRASGQLDADVDLVSTFVFPGEITGPPLSIPIQYDHPGKLRFAGVMTDDQRDILLNHQSLVAVTTDAAYRRAIESLHQQSLQIFSAYRASVDALYQQSRAAATEFLVTEIANVVGATLTLPDTHPSVPIRYDAATATLRFVGVMSAAEQTALKGVASNPLSAIDALFNQQRLAVKFYEPLFSAPLDQLPPGLDFAAQLPQALAVKIAYAEEERVLQFTGFLRPDEQALLTAMVPGTTPMEVAFHAALASLAAQPGTIVSPDARVWMSSADLDTAQPASDTPAKRMATAAARALRYVSASLASNAVIESGSASLGLSAPTTRYLFTRYARFPGSLLDHLTGTFAAGTGPVDYGTVKATFDAWFWAIRVASILKKWKVTLAELKAIDTIGLAARLLDLGTLPLDSTTPIAAIDGLLDIHRLLRLRDEFPETKLTFLELLTKVATGAYTAERVVLGLPPTLVFEDSITKSPHNIGIHYDAATRTLRATGLMSDAQMATLLNHVSLVAVTGISEYRQAIDELHRSLRTAFAADVERVNDTWPAADVAAFIASLDLAYPSDYLLAESWERLRRAFSFAQSLSTSPDLVTRFASPAMNDWHTRTVKELLRARFGAESWLMLCAEIQDVVRERKRDALAAYLLTQPKPTDAPTGKWENVNDLYAYYLLDIEMGACQLTSRLVQGAGSVQLFVQRGFMGLEPKMIIQANDNSGDSAWRWWSWMRKYRVWEANRKVFLWPENWIEPELKKDRSPFFRALEDELMQNEVSQASAEAAFANYLAKLNGVAHLEIVGFYQQDNADDTIMHVFGRTPGTEPHRYYYRRYDYRQWTPWEEVELDIQGHYLVPAVINHRVFLFWPVFREVPDEPKNSTVTLPASPGSSTSKFVPDKTSKRLRMQMAVSEYRQGRWTPKSVSTDFAESDPYEGEIDTRFYKFIAIDKSAVDGRFYIKHQGVAFDPLQWKAASKTLSQLGWSSAKAPLYGEISMSGCRGAHDLRFRSASDMPSWDSVQIGVRAEEDSAGGSTVAGRWLERQVRYDSYVANVRQDDFTILNEYSLTQPMLSPVLMATPGLYGMAPGWQCSYMDTLWLTPGDGMEWIGTWLPFFYNDASRTFFVLPTDRSSSAGGVSLGDYYPDIKRTLRGWERTFQRDITTWIDGFIAGLDTVQRSALEYWLVSNPQVTQYPPYSDQQLKSLMLQFQTIDMRRWVKELSDDRFQYRRFDFRTFYHPFVCDFARLVNNPLEGIPALMRRDTQFRTSSFRFADEYQPTAAVFDDDGYPAEDVDFSPAGAYASYNWELFFHAPLLIANALSRNQRFEEARAWYHYIFNPLGVESAATGASPMSKYWITKPFFQTGDPQYVQQRIDNILHLLAGDSRVPYSAEWAEAAFQSVQDWRTNPFEPHRIANYRTVAYQKTVVMKYVENLVAWGDYLFRQDTMESINEATQLYIMAAEILGPRPRLIPPRAKPPVESFNELEYQLDHFGNALVEVENLVPPMPGGGVPGGSTAPLPMPYFCIPPNDKMLAHWDTVADRLYKIHHCMNIDGVVRQLSLFEPPIDPGALVKAVAGGLDVGAALADLNAALPLYRFDPLLRKANEVCADVKGLGAALLAALEKKDAEGLALLRQTHESRVLDAVKVVREQQILEAREQLETVKKSRIVAEARRDYYRDIEKLSAQEKLHLDKLALSHTLSEIAQGITLGASIISYLPAIDLGASGFGGSPIAKFKIGGLELGQAAGLASEVLSFTAQIASNDAVMASAKGTYERKSEEWKFLERVSEKELDDIDSRIAAATLRITVAERDLDQHVAQIENAKATEAFMRSKYTNAELYQWQVGQTSSVYFQSYKLAYDLAKRAERCFRFELGVQDSSYIGFGYWDSLKKGLLAGERLQYDLRRLEAAYLDQNRREFELTKHVSLALVDPLALVRLRETGRCFFRLPEEIFDLDYPGHYFRRLKSVSLSLPCVVGPYTTIGCTLRLLKNSVRINTANGDNGYPRNVDDEGLPADDSRFVEHAIPVKATAASGAVNDSGVFELSFRDERYLPFEGAGALSEWALELFSDMASNNPDPGAPDFGRPLRQFDYDTITDAVLHVKYTAREDAGPFKNGAVTHLRTHFEEDGSSGSLRLLNLRRDFPTEWYRFLNPTTPANGNVLEFEMSPRLFQWRDTGKMLKINALWVLARCADRAGYSVTISPPLPAPAPDATDPHRMILAPVNQYGGLQFAQKNVSANDVAVSPTGPPVTWQLRMARPGGGNLVEDPVTGSMEVEDVMLVLGYEWD